MSPQRHPAFLSGIRRRDADATRSWAFQCCAGWLSPRRRGICTQWTSMSGRIGACFEEMLPPCGIGSLQRRIEAALQLSRAAQNSADAARARARAARNHADQAIQPLEDQDSSEGGGPEGIAAQGAVNANDRQSRVRQESTHCSPADLGQRGATLRVWAADLAEQIADGAEEFAAYLEKSAVRGDRQQRLAIATAEHAVAKVAIENAARLRDQNTPYERGQPLPKLPGTPDSKDRLPDNGPDPD
jgi:hypothetical protein